MDRGTYVAASGGLLELRRMEIVNNNLANSNTPGFKGQFLINRTRQFEETLAERFVEGDPYARGDHARSPDAISVGTAVDFTPGTIKGTGNPLDVALREPNDFFVINTAEGVQYTRAGNFTLNAEGEIVTSDGQRVQGDGGAIIAPEGPVSISPNGTVIANRIEVGRLQVARFENPQVLTPNGANRFRLNAGAGGPVVLDDPAILPQSLEMSNVSAVQGMLQLISANRGFEMYSKSARTIDEMNQAAITQVGRTR